MMKFSNAILAFAILSSSAYASPSVEYDAIVVGAGAAGCPLAQTLAENGLHTLLIERGKDPRPDESFNKAGFSAVLRSDCVESFISNGVVVSTGNCIGGATAFNQGIFIEETSGWFEENFDVDEGFFNEELIREAYDWVRERVAPEAATQTTPQGQAYTADLIDAMVSQPDIDLATDVDQATVPEFGVWRPHTIFDNNSGERFSADKLLDRSNPNLVIMTEKEVEKVIFKQRNNLHIASCVQFTDESDNACIHSEGRIYLSAGAFHTPEILMKSGIKEGGEIVDNAEVGQNLSDKPGTFAVTFFQSALDYNEITLADVAANKMYTTVTGEQRTLLFEDSSVGGAEALDLILYEKTFVPTALRDSPFASTFVATADCCAGRGDPPGQPGFCSAVLTADPQACAGFAAIAAARCLEDLSFLASFVADPTSTGNVTLGENGLKVNVNYLDTLGDLDAFGEAAKTGYLIKSSMDQSKPTFPQTPANPVDPNVNCPIAYQIFSNAILEQAGVTSPFASDFTTVQPNLLELLANSVPGCCGSLNSLMADLGLDFNAALAFVLDAEPGCGLLFADGQNPCDAPNAYIGTALGDSAIISPHHFAGTARVGDVVNEEFKVKGVKKLYIADASVIPRTPRVNTMASVMMIGRLAGVAFANEFNSASTE